VSDGVEQSCAGGDVLHGGEGFEVALVGALGQFGAAVEVRDTLAHRSPSKHTVRVVVRWA
jgi:hypothetical protein